MKSAIYKTDDFVCLRDGLAFVIGFYFSEDETDGEGPYYMCRCVDVEWLTHEDPAIGFSLKWPYSSSLLLVSPDCAESFNDPAQLTHFYIKAEAFNGFKAWLFDVLDGEEIRRLNNLDRYDREALEFSHT